MRFYPHILNLFHADHFIYIDPQQLMVLILQPKAKRAYVSGGAVHSNHVYGTILLFHRIHLLTRLFYYSTFVRI